MTMHDSGEQSAAGSFEVDGRHLALDADGHLADAGQWNERVAVALAARDGLELTADQWWLVRFVRQHWERYGTAPIMRMIVHALRREFGDEFGSSRYLYRVFPDGPVRLACRYAGLPRPDSCI